MSIYFKLPQVIPLLISSLLFAAFTVVRDPFLNKASQANLAEIQAGKLAKLWGNPGIKLLAKQMVIDHIIAENELVGLAKKQNLAVATTLDLKHRQKLNDLKALSGKAFDSAYMASQLIDQKKAIALFFEESRSGKNQKMKEYAGKYLPKLQMHLQMFVGNGSALKMTMDSTIKK